MTNYYLAASPTSLATATAIYRNQPNNRPDALIAIINNDVAPLHNQPRLFLDSTRIQQLKSAILVPGSHHHLAVEAMKARVEQNDWRVYDENPTDGNWNYARSELAREAAFLYLLTDNSNYAQIAFNALYEIHNNPDPDNRLPESGYGLSRAAVGRNFAIAYDWAYNGLTQEQRNYIKDKIDLALDAWPSYSHPNLSNSSMASNWVAVCRGGELVMMLAVGEEQQRATRYEQLKSWLNTHIENAYGDLGVTQEGIGYDGYGGVFLVPAVLALRSVGDTSLDANFNSKAFWKLMMYAGSFAMDNSGEREFIQSGVSGTGIIDEGWASLLLGTVPQEQLSYYRYFYDHHMGVNAPGTPAQKFDDRNGGTVWSLIYYPENLTSTNPSDIFSKAVSDDDKGAYFFRNRWRDDNDVLMSIMADTEHHNNSWDEAEAFGLNLMAYDTHFIGSPGKSGDAANFSALLVDGLARTSSGVTGTKEFFTSNPNGSGYVIVDGGQKYSALGLTSTKRHLLVDFSGNAGTAIFSSLDRIEDESNHTYTWQLNLGDETSNGGVSATTGSEGGLPTFVLNGNNGSYLKGWVLYPTDASITAGDPLKVITSGANADIWVAMVLGTGVPPVGTVTGTGMNAVLEVGNARIQYDANSNRIVTESTGAGNPY